jgi:ribosome-associated toxin RatA of RatAB toxin-antitoxin module
MAGACRSHDEISLPYPPEMVWRALTELSAYPVWWPMHVEIHVLTHRPELLGSQLEISPRGGVRFVCEIVEIAPASQLQMDYVAGVFTGSGIWRLEETDSGGTRLSYAVDIRFRSRILAIMASLVDVKAIHVRLMRHIFQGLQDHLARQPRRGVALHRAMGLSPG